MGPNKEAAKRQLDKEVDEADKESFPASDPTSWTLSIDSDPPEEEAGSSSLEA